jgi:ribonuclease E
LPPKKTTKKSARKATEKKPARREKDGAPAEESMEAASARSRTTAARRRSGATAAKRGRREPETSETTAVIEAPRSVQTAPTVPSSPAEGRSKPGGAVVEEVNGKIVVRFPPVAPHPFPAPETAPVIPAGPRVPDVTPAAAPSRPAEPRRPHDREQPRGDRREPTVREPGPRAPTPERPVPIAREVAPEPSPPRDVPQRGPDQALEETGEGAPLSRSKRRRMRRRRNRDRQDDDGTPLGATPRPSPPAHEAPPRREAPVFAEPLEDDEAQPWISAAETIREEIRHGERPADDLEAEFTEPPETAEVVDEEDRDFQADEPEAPAVEVERDADRGRLRERARDRDHDSDRDDRRGRRRRRGRGGRGRGEVRVERESQAPERAAPAGGAGVREMIINAIPREECRIAILQGGRLEEIYMERATAENHVGNIYKGVVTNVEASIQAAFVDFGQGKNGFLHISDLHPQYFPDGHQQTENVGHKMPRRHRPPIQKCLRRGQEVIVQVTKEGIGTKGPTLSNYLSIPGRFLVMMPGMGKLGVSRRIEDDEQRDQLRGVLNELELPEGMGFIARTAALERSKAELQNDLNYLTRLWRAVENRMRSDAAPAELYRESDLMIRTIRDVFTDDVQRIIVDDPEVAQRARNFLNIFSPEAADLVTVFDGPEPIFHKYGIEQELERLHSRRVPLPAGGSLVIEPTEALVAIDVNSGSFRTEDDAENTAFKINVEAADEIARQLRLRDLGGVIICDFIDMRLESHRREIERRLTVNLREHKERVKVLRMSEFGIIELTRQRQRASLTRSVYQDCRHCRGTGLVKTIESVALDVMRLIQLAVTRPHIAAIEVAVSPDVAYLLQNRKRRLLHELENNNRRTISIRTDPNYSLDQVEIHCTDARGRVVPHT